MLYSGMEHLSAESVPNHKNTPCTVAVNWVQIDVDDDHEHLGSPEERMQVLLAMR